MSAIILRDEIVHYEVLGRGRPIIFIHDWVGSWRYWIPSMQSASISFRAYALDLWGFGDTAKNPNYYSIEQQVGLLDEFLAEMGIGKVALVGHGLGAVIALLYAGRNPQFVDRMIIASLAAKRAHIHERFQVASPAELAHWLISPNEANSPAKAEAAKADPKAILLSLSNLNDIDLTTILENSRTPTLLVHGKNDPAIDHSPADWGSRLPDKAHQILFDTSGHFPMLDEPSKFNRLLADFLSLPSGESPRQLQLKEEWKRRIR